MAKGIEIGVGVDGSAAEKGIKIGLIEPLEDAQDELTKLGKNKGIDELEHDLGEAAKATDKLKDETKRDADQIAQAYRDQARVAQRETGEATSAMKENFGSFKEEAVQNFSQFASSFSGDMSQASDAVQGTLGGLAASLPGPLGLVAGAAGAIGGALLTSAAQAEEAKEQARQAAAEWAQAYIDAGGKVLAISAQVSKANEIYGDADKYKEAKQNADDWAVSIETAVAAMSGNQAAINAVGAALDERRKKIDADKAAFAASLDVNGQYTEASEALSFQLGKDAARIDEATKSYTDLTTAQAAGRQQAIEYSNTLKQLLASADSAGEEVDELGNKLYTLPDGSQILIDVDTGLATTNLDKFKGDFDGVVEQVNNTKLKALNVDVVAPDPNAFISSYQQALDRQKLTVQATVTDRYGKAIL